VPCNFVTAVLSKKEYNANIKEQRKKHKDLSPESGMNASFKNTAYWLKQIYSFKRSTKKSGKSRNFFIIVLCIAQKLGPAFWTGNINFPFAPRDAHLLAAAWAVKYPVFLKTAEFASKIPEPVPETVPAYHKAVIFVRSFSMVAGKHTKHRPGKNGPRCQIQREQHENL
jgi:hypothetical protein